jgi:malate dehydrogenase (oxaloacetate-decarboxylating)(NADP+)
VSCATVTWGWSVHRHPRRRAHWSTKSTLHRGNLVAVVTNGTAVLGLGDIGPLASKPVMEGKAVLFKKFAGIDVFDLEIQEKDLDQAGRHHRRARAHLRRHQPRGHQGAGLLLRRTQAARAHEDPGLPRRPARHRDRRRRGAAQRLKVVGKEIDEVKLVTSGAGAAAGLPQPAGQAGRAANNIWVTDLAGVVYKAAPS